MLSIFDVPILKPIFLFFFYFSIYFPSGMATASTATLFKELHAKFQLIGLWKKQILTCEELLVRWHLESSTCS